MAKGILRKRGLIRPQGELEVKTTGDTPPTVFILPIPVIVLLLLLEPISMNLEIWSKHSINQQTYVKPKSKTYNSPEKTQRQEKMFRGVHYDRVLDFATQIADTSV